MADRFPLIVNASSRKIEELVAGDNLDLTGNGIIVSGDVGNGKYLKSDGGFVVWDSPGDVYLTASQTLQNKTLESCTISGSLNFLSNIPNSALSNASININGTGVMLGDSVTTPDNNTTYTVSAVDGVTAQEKIIRLTSGGNAGAGVDDDITLIGGSNVTLSRLNDEITINSSFTDTNTVTRVASATGGSFVSGDVEIAAGAFTSVSQTGSTITIAGQDTDTITQLRVGIGGSFAPGDFTIIQGANTTITQSTNDITIASDDTVTRVRGGLSGGSYVTGDVDITGGGDTTVSQSGNTITISSTDSDTITRLRGTTSGTYTSGDLTIVAGGATTVSQTGSTITISSVNTDTNYAVSNNGGLNLTPSNQFEIKNVGNFSDSRLIKWDNANKQFVSGIIEDDGSSVTIGGDLIIEGTTTTVDSTTVVVNDNELELRKGSNIVGTDGGIRLNRTTNGAGVVQSYSSLQWLESGGYWRITDGSVHKQIVTDIDAMTLTNKTLTSPTLTNPVLGAATATTINGLAVTTTVGSTLTVASNKTATVNNTLTFQGTDNATASFGAGGTVAYTNTNTLGDFQTTTSTLLRGVISDSTGTASLVFSQSPQFSVSLQTDSTSFDVFNTTATTINAFGDATTLNLGVTQGNTNVLGNLVVAEDATFGTVSGDTFTVNGTTDFVNNDIIVRGSSGFGLRLGRGNNAIATNTAVGFNVLGANTTGLQNTGLGYSAIQNLTVGVRNTSVGYQALAVSQEGQDNVAMGVVTLLNLSNGQKNVAVGNSSGDQLTGGDANVFLGYYAGYNCQGSGNVIIGPADTSDPADSATYAPVNATGNRQLVIGSGTETWLSGDANFNIFFPQSITTGFDTTIGGDLNVNGSHVRIKASNVSIVDKDLEIGATTNTNFNGTVTDNSPTITGVTTTSGLVPGMEIVINTVGITVDGGATARIQSIDVVNESVTLDNNLLGSSGNASFTATGPNDFSADGGGLILKGSTDHTILWENSTDQWEVSENFNVPTGRAYRWNNEAVIQNQQIGPSTTGTTWTLGSDVTASSLTSVGTLNSLTVGGVLLVGTNSTSNNIASAIFEGNPTTNVGNFAVTSSTSTPAVGEQLGNLAFADSGHVQSAFIGAGRDGGTWTSGSSQPTLLKFNTTPDGSASPGGFTRMTIRGDGKVSISSDGTADGLLTIKGDSDATGTPSIRLLDGSDTREVSVSNTAGDFVVSTHGTDNNAHGQIKIFESGIIQLLNGGASGTLTERLRVTTDGQVLIGTDIQNSFNGVGQAHNLIVAGSTSDTDITDNSSAAITISNTDGTANNTAGLHFAREDTDGNPHYTGASIVTQFKETQVTGQYPKADLVLLTSTSANNAPSEKMRVHANGAVTKPDNPLIQTVMSDVYGASQSLTTSPPSAISNGGASISRGTNGFSTTGANAYTYVCPVDGIYAVFAHISLGNVTQPDGTREAGDRTIWTMGYTLGGGNLPLQNYVEIIDTNVFDFENASYYNVWNFTAGTRVGCGLNSGNGTASGLAMQWGIHLIQ